MQASWLRAPQREEFHAKTPRRKGISHTKIRSYKDGPLMLSTNPRAAGAQQASNWRFAPKITPLFVSSYLRVSFSLLCALASWRETLLFQHHFAPRQLST
jgi:hypothetical protein